MSDRTGKNHTDDRQTCVVKIFGREYPLRCDGNRGRLMRIAELVDAKMRQIADNSNVISHSDIAVLAALNITNELLEAEEVKGGSSEDFNDRTENLLLKLESALPGFQRAGASD